MATRKAARAKTRAPAGKKVAKKKSASKRATSRALQTEVTTYLEARGYQRLRYSDLRDCRTHGRLRGQDIRKQGASMLDASVMEHLATADCLRDKLGLSNDERYAEMMSDIGYGDR